MKRFTIGDTDASHRNSYTLLGEIPRCIDSFDASSAYKSASEHTLCAAAPLLFDTEIVGDEVVLGNDRWERGGVGEAYALA